MRRTFLIWLFIFICAAFAVTAGVTYWRFQRHAEQQAEQLMSTRLRDLMELVEHTHNSMQRLMRINDESSLARTRAMAEIVKLHPAILQDQEGLQGLCNDLGAEQVAITDEKGVVRAAVPDTYVGIDLAAEKDGRGFMDCIRTPGHEYVQRPKVMGLSTMDAELQYVGVHRQDQPGLVRLGFRPYHEERAKENASYSRLAANHRLGSTGRIIAFRGGAALNREAVPGPVADFLSLPLGKLGRLDYNEQQHFTYAVEKDGFRLVGILPLADLYPMGLHNMRSQLITNCIVFIVVFALVSVLLERIVVSGITKVNETLRRITEGDVAARVDVSTTPEFVRLSTGINGMLDYLKVLDDKEQARRAKEHEMARYIQRSTLPSAENLPRPANGEFGVCASLIPAASVGGDFYDVFMTDPDHLSFMVAAVSGSGVPAALIMMRALSVIRSFARIGLAPAAVLAGANRVLCEGRTADQYVTIFYGNLEISTGTLTCVNAGHDAPLVQHVGEASYSEMSIERSPVLGAVAGVRFRSEEVQLEPGDRLFLYTGGLLRAENPQKMSFGLQRLLDTLESKATELAELPNIVRKSLRRFTEGMEQEQDITILALEYRSTMRRGGRVKLAAGEPAPLLDLMGESLEAVFAAPVDIEALKQAARETLAALPPGLEVTATLGCSETQAELSFTYPGGAHNPLDGRELPAIDQPRFEHSAEGNRLTLSKTLG